MYLRLIFINITPLSQSIA